MHNLHTATLRFFLASALTLCFFAILSIPHVYSATFYSRQTGNWSNTTTWSLISHVGGAAPSTPTAGDDVIIGLGHVVTFNMVGITIQSLNIQQGTVQYENVLAARDLTINNSLTISPTGIFTVAITGMSGNNQLRLLGNVANNGVWTMRPVANSSTNRATTTFAGVGLQTVSGTGLTRLYRVALDKGSLTSTVDVSMNIGISSVSVATEPIFYIVNGGTWRQSAGTLTFDDGVSNSSAQTIEVTGRLHIAGTANMIFGQNGAGASMFLTGGELLFNTSGVPSQIGIMVGNSLRYNGADVGRITMQSGTVVVAGRISQDASGANTSELTYTQSGGTMIVGNAGHVSGSRGTFDLPRPGSSFTMSGGTLLLRGNNNNAPGTRPADFRLGGTVTVSGGTVQFADGSSAAGEVFDYDVPSSAVFNNIVVGNTTARLSPFSVAQTLRIAGNLTADGIFNASVLGDGTTSAPGSAVTLQGNNSATQTVGGAGTLTFQNLTMNRQGAGSGVVALNRSATVRGVFDLQEGGNANAQILALGANIDLTVTNDAAIAVADGASTRYVLTTATSGRLIRALLGGSTYDFPIGSVGSGIKPQTTYTPFSYRADVGALGQIGVRVAAGGNPAKTGGHTQLKSSWENYLRRVWSVTTTGLSGTGQMTILYPDDFAGTIDALRIGRYVPNETVAGGTWTQLAGVISGTTASVAAPGVFTTPILAAANVVGDWTLVELAQRIFYSRTSGAWTDASTWSFASHTGSPVGTGIAPSKPQDSVVIGGGVSGSGNHVVTLATNVSIGGMALGTGISNTGTLECQSESAFSGDSFTFGDVSTLRVGSTQGISALPNLTGNIRSVKTRGFTSNARYEYIGAGSQFYGSGLPTAVRSLWITKAFGVPLQADKSVAVWRDVNVNSGILDVSTFTLNNVTTASADAASSAFTLAAGTALRIGGVGNMTNTTVGVVRNYAAYMLDSTSTVDFYGTTQTIEPAPLTAGYGSVIARNAGVKRVQSAVLVRGNLFIRDAATLLNEKGSGVLRILGNCYNNAILINDGILDIGR